METKVEICAEQPGDDPFLRNQICRACWHQSYASHFSRRDIDSIFDGDLLLGGSWLERRDGILGRFCAWWDGRMVGFIEVGALRNPAAGEVISLYVQPEYQHRGAGRALWQKGCEVLRAAGFSHLEVWAISDAPACAFYAAQGCVVANTGWLTAGEVRVTVTGFEKAL